MDSYEQKYKKAIELMKDCVPDENGLVHVRPQDIFAELTESADERIRKEIIYHIQNCDDTIDEETGKRMLAWLEKQRPSGCPEYCVMSNCSNCPNRPIVVKQKPYVSETMDEKGDFDNGFTRMMEKEQKPVEWSDKNKEMAIGILNYLCFSTDATDLEGFDEWYDWLKFITKEGVLPQPKQELSDVDKVILFRTIDSLKFLKDTISTDPKYAINIIDIEREIAWLKSIRTRNRWKPSESDILLLERIANGTSNPQDFQASLGGLIGQLKKLREE